MPKPLLTIGVPTYNRADSLATTLASARAQAYRPLEIVVCDNASDDGTEGLVAQLQSQDDRIRYVRQETNVGSTGNFRRALAEARGDLFMWLADDDWIDPDYAGSCAAALTTGVALAAGRTVYYRDGAVRDEGEPSAFDAPDGPGRVRQFYRRVVHNPAFYGVARTSVLRELGPYPNALGGDWLWTAALAYTGRVVEVPGVVIHRSAQGVSASLARTAESLGLPARHATVPYLTIALNAAKHVLTASPYAELSSARRTRLAAAATAAVVWRYLLLPVLAPAGPLLRRLGLRGGTRQEAPRG
ncbi:MAG: glycosyl transferase family 2 [Frankiales bacterium]|nr:glycosyl transferase family 2 [Frankiales bacterium]